jgi:CubicO group peptidase (beta-lactamase class C family)
MSAGGLSQARLARMHEVLTGYVDRGDVPGLVATISRRGEVVRDAIGTLADDSDRAVESSTLFRISSMTKPITAVATMMLIEEGTLELDEPVDRLLPELAQRRVLRRLDGPLDDTVPAERPITIRDLLTFRMGFGQLMATPDAYPILKLAWDEHIGMGPPAPGGTPEPNEWLRRLGELPLMYQPGERWLYNTGADVLGPLIARATDQPFEAFLRERIFDPLGMRDTAFSVAPEQSARFATSYMTDFQTGERIAFDPPVGGQWNQPPAFPSGAAGLVSTVDDYLQFGQMLLNKGMLGGQRILSRPSVEVMTSDQLTPEQKAVSGMVPGFFDRHGWGFLMSVVTRRQEVYEPVGQFGWDGGLGTAWHADPSEDMQTMLMTQTAWRSPAPPPICRAFWTLAYAAIDD